MMYDTHCHPYLQKEKKTSEILENFKKSSGDFLNSIAVDIETSIKSIDLAKQNDFIRASVGIHPCDIIQYKGRLKEVVGELEKLYLENKREVVAIGECGLDYHWLDSMSKEAGIERKKIIELQKDFFKDQIILADRLGLPIIIHNRNSKDDIFEILKELRFKNFIFHCYSENLEYAEKLIAFAPDCMISFSGIVTFKNALSVQETAKSIPLKNIIIETDSPYLTPTPFRGKQENEPLLVKYVLEKIIELRSESSKEIEKKILENSLNFFGLK